MNFNKLHNLLKEESKEKHVSDLKVGDFVLDSTLKKILPITKISGDETSYIIYIGNDDVLRIDRDSTDEEKMIAQHTYNVIKAAKKKQ